MPRRNTIEIVINASDQTGGIFDSLDRQITNVAKTAGLAVAALGAVAAGVSAVAVNEFSKFERGMNEVFTLIPGASAQMREQLEFDIETLANKMGVLPEQSIPALYQALSAGVPPDNVYDFLEIANKAAVGGVTELETAVDGITSVVNAYGRDIMDAGKASDIMFTAVRLGKTDFDQLSNSLFQVIPMAAATNTSFETIAAGLAAITAQGTPTSVATTQLRAMLVELSDSGSEVGETLERLAGKSYKELMDEGVSMETILFRLGEEAKAQGKSINELFSSVEAGSAALGLTGSGAEMFANALAEMGNSAGATDAAFAQMDQGFARSMEKMGAAWNILLTNLGENLAPVVQPLIDLFASLFRFIGAAIGGEGDMLNDWLMDLPEPLRAIATAIADVINWFINAGQAIGRFIGAIAAGVDPVDAFKQLMLDLLPRDIAIMINDLVDGIVDLVGRIQDWIAENPELAEQIGKIALMALIGIPVLGKLKDVVGGAASAAMRFVRHGGGAALALGGLVLLAGQGDELAAALADIADGFALLASGNYDEGIDKVSEGMNELGSVIENTIMGLADWALAELGRIFGFEPPRAAEGLQAFVDGLKMGFLAVGIIIDRIGRSIDRFLLDAQIEIYKLVYAAQQATGITIIPNIELKAQYAQLVRDSLDIADKFEAAIHGQLAGKSPMDISGDLAYATSDQAALDFGYNTAKLIADSLSEESKRLLPESIARSFSTGDMAALEVQLPILANLNVDHEAMILQIAQHVLETEGEIAAMGFLETVGIPLLTDLDIPTNTLVTQFQDIVANAAQSTTYQATATAAVTVNAGSVNTSSFAATVATNIRNVLSSLGSIAQNPLGAIGGFLGNLQSGYRGYAMGTNFVPATGLYQLHQGEQVIPAGETTSNRNTTINVNFNGTGAPATRQEAENVAYQVVAGIRARGIEI